MDRTAQVDRAFIITVIAIVSLLFVTCGASADTWNDRAAAAIAIHNAIETNPWLPPVPPKAPESPPPPKSGTKVDQRPIVYRLTANWCAPCRALGAALTKDVRDKLPFQIVDWDVDRQGYMGAPTIPAFWWKSPQGNRRVSWSSIGHLVTTWEATQKPAAKATANNYTPSWTYPGEIRRHLMSTHGIAEAGSLSQDDAERVHDALHNGFTPTQIRRYALQHGLISK